MIIVYKIGRLNNNGGLMFYYQLIPFVLMKSEPSNLSDFQIKLIQELNILGFWSVSNLGLS